MRTQLKFCLGQYTTLFYEYSNRHTLTQLWPLFVEKSGHSCTCLTEPEPPHITH